MHDFAGHPFQADLSRQLARDGYHVVHGFCGGVTTGRGDLEVHRDDPVGLTFVDLHPMPFERYSIPQRLRSELRYGRSLAGLIRRFDPDLVISGNTPLLAQAQAWRACSRAGIARHYWLQDFLGVGTERTLAQRSPLLGATAGRAFARLEVELLRRSTSIVAISDDFVAALEEREVGVPTTVIENWAPIPDEPDPEAVRAWRRATVPDEDLPIVLYAGTLGLKHNPEHLASAASAVAGKAWVVVITEGLGRDYLEEQRATRGIENLILLDFVPFEELPVALGAADVCLTLLEADAGTFSVPSKVLTYLASGRPIVAAMPAANLATRVIGGAEAGITVEPHDTDGFAAAIQRLVIDEDERLRCGRNARTYASKRFDLTVIATDFERVFDQFTSPRTSSNQPLFRREPINA